MTGFIHYGATIDSSLIEYYPKFIHKSGIIHYGATKEVGNPWKSMELLRFFP